MKNKNLNGGFVGLLMLLIVVAGIIFFIVRTDLFTGGKLDKNATEEGTNLEGQNMLEQGQSAIQKAKDAKALLEQNDKNRFGQ
jgi:hypothetical protein